MLKRLNVGCGRNALPGWINLDGASLPGVDIVTDLEHCDSTPLPIESESIDEFLLQHVLEHITRPLPLMQELHRVAKPGARALVKVPYGTSDDAWEDPTHVRPFFLGSFGYFSQPLYWRADYGYRGDWQPERIILFIARSRANQLSAQEVMAQVQRERNLVLEMHAELRAIKPIRQPLKELQQSPQIQLELVANM